MAHYGRAALALLSVCSIAFAEGRAGTESDVRLSATALMMGGANQILSVPPAPPERLRGFVEQTYRDSIAPTGLCGSGPDDCDLVVVYTPAQFGPFTGLHDLTFDESVAAAVVNLDDCLRGKVCTVTQTPYTQTGQSVLSDTAYVVKGISQSAVVIGNEKAGLIANPVSGKTVNFVITASTSRPNGGLFQRFAGLHVVGITFNGATPTDSPRSSPLTTVDVARQYDGWADFPNYPLNPLSTANALAGLLFLHARQIADDDPKQLQGYYQDTTYYMVPTEVLPLLLPLNSIPVIGPPLARVFDAPLRVIVETGYDRTINPGQPTRAQFRRMPKPWRTIRDLAIAIPTGWDDAISYATGNPASRPFRTLPQPVYGVGGPPVYAGAVDPYGPVAEPAASAPARSGRKPRPANTLSRGSLRRVSAPAKTAPDPSLSTRRHHAANGTLPRPKRP